MTSRNETALLALLARQFVVGTFNEPLITFGQFFC
jgi:hypothetical protein